MTRADLLILFGYNRRSIQMQAGQQHKLGLEFTALISFVFYISLFALLGGLGALELIRFAEWLSN